MKVLLDTNVYTAFKRGDPTALARVRSAKQAVFSAIVAGELLFGFRHGARFEHNHRALQTFLAHPRVSLLPVTLVTADRFGAHVRRCALWFPMVPSAGRKPANPSSPSSVCEGGV